MERSMCPLTSESKKNTESYSFYPMILEVKNTQNSEWHSHFYFWDHQQRVVLKYKVIFLLQYVNLTHYIQAKPAYIYIYRQMVAWKIWFVKSPKCVFRHFQGCRRTFPHFPQSEQTNMWHILLELLADNSRKRCTKYICIYTLLGSNTYPHYQPACLKMMIFQLSRLVGYGLVPKVVTQFYLEDHPRTCKWLITLVIVSPLRIGLWDPFQMAFSWLLNGGY